ncbi:MAG: type II toxin-antitoxin system VapC family toxin [Pseudomonadales bacterium]
MKLLLDTHVFLWLACQSNQLPADVLSLCEIPENQLYLSVVSNWEMQIKHQLGKLTLPTPRERLVAKAQEEGIDILTIENHHIDVLDSLEMTHRDPFDRLLMAQAQSEGLTLITADQKIHGYYDQVAMFWPGLPER